MNYRKIVICHLSILIDWWCIRKKKTKKKIQSEIWKYGHRQFGVLTQWRKYFGVGRSVVVVVVVVVIIIIIVIMMMIIIVFLEDLFMSNMLSCAEQVQVARPHIKHLCRILFCQLRRLGKIRPFLSTDAANKLAVSFVLTRLDYCNSLLAGLPDNKLNKLQRIQNHAARIVLRKPRHVSATSLLRTLHWLPVKARIQYKIACLCFQCLSHNTMPPYLSDLLHSYQPPRTLRSLDTSLLSVPRFCLETFGRRSFSAFGPTVWNSLPLPLRKTQCFSTFKKKLKTHLFEKHLSWYLQACSSVYVAQLVCVCVCVRVRVCVCVCVCVCDTLFMVMTAGMMYMMLWNDSPHPPHNMYVYFLCGLVCTCIHESDAELICVCFSQTF